MNLAKLGRIWSDRTRWLTPETSKPTAPGPASPALNEQQIRLLIQFMSEIGAAMNGAGDATTFIRRSLQRIGSAYGLTKLSVFVVPTLLLLRYGDDRATFVDLSSQIPSDLRLDQIAALYELVDEAQAARITPSQGLQRLHVILAMPPRFTAYLRIAGLVMLSVAITLLLNASWQELSLSLALAFLVGTIREAGYRWPQVWPLLPALSGLLAGAVAFLAIGQGMDCRPIIVLIPPLATFLPGATLTVSMIELSNGDIVAGGSRLAYGAIRLFLLVFGLIVAGEWVGLPDAVPTPQPIGPGGFATAASLLLFTSGICIHFSTPKGAFSWLLLVVATAWLGQQVGSWLFSDALGGFVGGAAMIVVARLIEGRPKAPPLLVSFTPAFWLLVPGAIGLRGVSEIFNEGPASAVDDILLMLVTMISVALGVSFGLIITGSNRAQEPT